MVAICSTISILLGLKLKGKSLSEALILKHKLTQNMATDCFLNCEFSTYVKITSSEHVMYINCSEFQTKTKLKQFMYTTCSELVIFMYWTRNSMNNLLSYCGLVDARISASEKDLPVII